MWECEHTASSHAHYSRYLQIKLTPELERAVLAVRTLCLNLCHTLTNVALRVLTTVGCRVPLRWSQRTRTQRHLLRLRQVCDCSVSKSMQHLGGFHGPRRSLPANLLTSAQHSRLSRDSHPLSDLWSCAHRGCIEFTEGTVHNGC